MLHAPLLIPPSADFWPQVTRTLLADGFLARHGNLAAGDFAHIRVVVPGAIHGHYLKRELAAYLQRPFLPPRVGTLSAWLSLQPPDPERAPASHSERLMELYAELRQHAWLKSLFTARRNTDLLPLAQTLIALFDELTRALLPTLHEAPAAAAARWQNALEQLPPPVRGMLSDEAQLVWKLWQSQLDGRDPIGARYAQLMRLAAQASEPLIWMQSSQPDSFEQAFLDAYARRQPVLPMTLDWRCDAVPPAYAAAWPEMLEDAMRVCVAQAPPARIALSRAVSLEDEAQRGAQTVIAWLQEGKEDIAIIAQDRVVARRMRALLERAGVVVADETGWKLSTTRAAAAVAALMDVVTTRAETLALLDLLKSPFLAPALPDKTERVMQIERALRRRNVLGGWDAAVEAIAGDPLAAELLQQVAAAAQSLGIGRKTLCAWMDLTNRALLALNMRDAMQADSAGAQVLALFDAIATDCSAATHAFSFNEWRAFLNMQLESAPYLPADDDRRVVMLQLSGTQLRSFDAVLMVGADAEHLPSRINDVLFFANAVRRELGLPTREQRQRQQLRDFAELLSSNAEVVLSWQTRRNGEPNTVSNWIARLQLAMQRAGVPPLPVHESAPQLRRLQAAPVAMPAPVAPHLLPQKLSASAWNLLAACPYQFFATRMLGLSVLDDLSELPEKRDYGEWLHTILKNFHEALRDRQIANAEREPLLRAISEEVFSRALEHSAAALGYYVRWQKAIPAYLAWVEERQAEGWRFLVGEERLEAAIEWEGGSILLHGIVDRIDEHESGERAVLDYKTKDQGALAKRLKEQEDHQLAFYGLLAQPQVAHVAHAHYVGLEASKDKIGHATAQRYDEWQTLLRAQIVSSMQAISNGAALNASGIERVCTWCEVRGLCRKGAW